MLKREGLQRYPWRRWMKPQFFVVKRSFGYREDHLEHEMEVLKKFRGALHILQLFYVDRTVLNPILDAPGLTVVTEWIENGTLSAFMERVKRENQVLPNRLLLRIFSCFVQFCVAMAWPPRGPEGATPQTERIPENEAERKNKYQIRHADMHLANVMIGSLDGNSTEHKFTPIMKLIDFDQAHIVKGDGSNPIAPNVLGVQHNIRDIGMLMRTLITGDVTMMPPRAVKVTVNIGGTSRGFVTEGADVTTARHPRLDAELGALVQWCLATPPNSRPSVEQLHSSLGELITKATPSRYSGHNGGFYESDDQIRRLVQRLILDAPSS
ncbi:hypothetical protein HD806DRAFT_500252 [Xylariaceae sp. AK1471]|nr:hypothetical protein HD806DRAFT_500252 [Xylariaceae sp. AK1471]